MHRCPRCDYVIGHLPGAPPDRFGAFAAQVTCPECALEIPAGARLVVGSSIEAGAQPLTRARRNRQVMVAAAPLAYLLVMGLEGAFGIASKWSAGVRTWDVVKSAFLVIIGFALWRAWVKWTPDAAKDGRAPATFDQRWLCVPGALVVFRGEPSGPAAGHADSKRHEATDIRSINAGSPPSRGHRWKVGDGAVAAVTAHVWVRGADGRRSDMTPETVFVDTGAGSGPPGSDRTIALLEAGNHVARCVRAAIGLGDAVQESPGTNGGADLPAAIAIEGRLHAYPPWPAPAAVLNLAFALPITVATIAVLSWVTIAMVVPATARPTLPPALDIALKSCAAVLPAGIVVWVVLLRRLRRRTLVGCRWDVGPLGLRVTERHVTPKGVTVEEFVRDIEAGRIAGVELRTQPGLVRLVACGRDGNELAGMSPDMLPDDGAEALVRRVQEVLRPSAPVTARRERTQA